MQLGFRNDAWPMTLGPSKHVEAKVSDAATVGFKADNGELVVLFATPRKAELRVYRPNGQMKLLAEFDGAQHIACDDVGLTLRFSIGRRGVFDYPKGRSQWAAYRA